MISVAVTVLVDQKLDQLFDVLLEEDYFSERSNALQYCNNIRAFIKSLPDQKHYLTSNNQWGTYYALYKANRRTTWFIIFDNIDDELLLVRNIFNNHTEEYPRFITG